MAFEAAKEYIRKVSWTSLYTADQTDPRPLLLDARWG